MNILANITHEPVAWSRLALTSPTMLRCAAIALVCLMVVLLGAKALACLGPPNGRRFGGVPRLLRLIRDCDGTATVEFVLVTPIVLFMVLVLIQTMLVMTGNLYVHYAAFAATRSAMVQVPFDDSQTGGEPANVVLHSQQSPKYGAIRSAAVHAMVPVCGRLEAESDWADDFVAGLANMYEQYGQDTPNWVTRLAGDRLRYADANTDVFLIETAEDSNGEVRFLESEPGVELVYGPKDPVTIRVNHRLKLSTPYVRAIFADRDALEAGFGGWGFSGNDDAPGGPYATINAQYTLTNEGIYDQLPAPPRLPRIP